MKPIKKNIEFKIAADGGSASGKTTAGKIIAKNFKMEFLSSGALYRYCALKIINSKKNCNKRLLDPEKQHLSKKNVFLLPGKIFYQLQLGATIFLLSFLEGDPFHELLRSFQTVLEQNREIQRVGDIS